MAVSLDYSDSIVLETEVATEKNISHGKLEKNILKHLEKMWTISKMRKMHGTTSVSLLKAQ